MKIRGILAGFMALALLCSCSTFNSVLKPGNDAVSGTDSPKKAKEPKVNKEYASKKVKVEPGKKTSTSKQHHDVRPMGNVPSVAELCSGQWVITNVQGTDLHGEDEAPYVAFDRTGRFYANDGCNYLNGYYVLRTDGVMTLNQVLNTLRMCEDESAYMIDGVLSDGAKLYIDSKRIGQETYMYLKNSSGKTQMTLRRHNMEFLNGNWQVTSLDGNAVAEDDMTVFFDIPELKMHANTGCNFVNGDIYIDPERSNALDISNMAVTRMSCPRVQQETAMLVALEKTASAIAGHNSESVMLLDKKGKELMILKRLSVAKPE